MNWAKLAKNIPAKVKIGSKANYQVVTIKQFDDETKVGEMNPNTKQIIIKNKLSSKAQVETYLHEILHAISDEHGVGLTEQQVLEFESSFPYLINIISELNKG